MSSRGRSEAGSPDIAAAWERFSGEYQDMAALQTGSAHYGPDVAGEDDLRLLGDLKGKRVLELGCGAAQCSISFARAGAIAIGVDFSSSQLALARQLCDEEGVKVEFRHGDMADLAFLRADTIDVVFSSFAFQYVEDLNRVFRQVHRVLKVGAPLVFSLPHPAWALARRTNDTEGLNDTADEPAGRAALVLRPETDRDGVGRCRLDDLPSYVRKPLHGPVPGQLPGGHGHRARAQATSPRAVLAAGDGDGTHGP